VEQDEREASLEKRYDIITTNEQLSRSRLAAEVE